MNRMIRSLRSTLGAAVILCAFADRLLGDTSASDNSVGHGGGEQQRRRHHDELTFTQIDVPDATLTVASGINDRGQIVGLLVDTGNVVHGFLLDKGVSSRIDPPGATFTQPLAINDQGQIVGIFEDAGGHHPWLSLGTMAPLPQSISRAPRTLNSPTSTIAARSWAHFQNTEGIFHGFLLEQGVFTRIEFPGAIGTEPTGINDRGQVTGLFLDAGAVIHRFLLDKGAFTQIEIPGETTMPFGDPREAVRINNRGQIVTNFQDTPEPPAPGVQPVHGLLIEDGAFTQFDVPGASGTSAAGINDRGQIVGSFFDAGGIGHGFLLDQDIFTQFDVPGASLTRAMGINKRGQIVGDFADSAGIFHGFLATEEQFNGRVIGVGASQENATVEIVGSFTSPTDLDLNASTLTITNLPNEQAGGGELVNGLPIVLTAVPRSRRKLAQFVDRSRPNIVSVTILDAGSGTFTFRIKVNDATINSPQNCSPTRLTTSFRLEASSEASIVVSTARPWSCFGPSNRFLKTH